MTIPADVYLRNDGREITGWLVYDWANSAFSTTVIRVLAGPYLTQLAQHDVGRNGVVATLGPFGSITALSLFPYCISTSVFLQVLLLPVLGAIADCSQAKKRLMAAFCYAGVIATCLLFFIGGHRYLAGGLLMITANFAFGVTIVLYNGFSNDITTEDRRDKVSSQGYALAYLGGGMLLAANLGLVSASDRFGIPKELAVRLSLLSAGV
jgi:UMF1 family MFS transporter